MTHHKAVGHLLESERGPFSKIHISQKKETIANMNILFLSLEEAVGNSEDRQRPSHGLDLLFSPEKSLLRRR